MRRPIGDLTQGKKKREIANQQNYVGRIRHCLNDSKNFSLVPSGPDHGKYIN